MTIFWLFEWRPFYKVKTTDKRTDACSRPLCIYTEIWIPQQPIKRRLKHEKKNNKIKKNTFILCNFSVRTLQYFQFFFAHENIRKLPSKVAHNRPQTFFFKYWLGCPNQPRIDFSCYKYVPRLICLLICGQNQSSRS